VKIDPSVYIPGVRGYYSLPDGRLASMPFNSSTAMMWINKDAFARAGLDAEKPPTTWQGVVEAARAIKARNAAPIPMTTAWPTWVHFEQYGAMHNLPFATKGNGFDGLDTELRINAPAYAKHLQRLLDMGKEGLFRWGGRDNAAEPLFVSGEAAIQFTSSAGRAAIARDAKFNWAMAMLPTDPEVNPNPINSVIGGASIWTMTAPNRTLAEYRAVANFFAYISQPAVDAEWHQRTGYVPVTSAAYEVSKGQGFYEKTPGTDLPILQLSRGQLSENSRGFRLGRMVELRNIIQEEMERALQGQQTAQAALDSAVQRGNRVLREFERTARG
jgi:sn-glycerol 3-phosphate transport system substrate-binding protein